MTIETDYIKRDKRLQSLKKYIVRVYKNIYREDCNDSLDTDYIDCFLAQVKTALEDRHR